MEETGFFLLHAKFTSELSLMDFIVLLSFYFFPQFEGPIDDWVTDDCYDWVLGSSPGG